MKITPLKMLAVGFGIVFAFGLVVFALRKNFWSAVVLGESLRIVAGDVVTAPLRKADCVVKVYNQSAVEQEIVGVRTSCSCTAAITQFPLKILPNTTEDILMLVTTNQHRGKRDYPIEFYLGDGTIINSNLVVISQ